MIDVERLASGGQVPLLVADFMRFSAAPRFSELLSAEANGHSVYQADPVSDLAGQRVYVPISDLAREYGRKFLAVDGCDGDVAVIGDCSAAALALRLGEELASYRAVTVFLVRPAWPDTDMVRTEFLEFRASLGSPDGTCPDLDADPYRALTDMEALLAGALSALAAAHGLSDASGALGDFLGRYWSWLGFLLASRDDLRRPFRADARVRVLGEAGFPDDLTADPTVIRCIWQQIDSLRGR